MLMRYTVCGMGFLFTLSLNKFYYTLACNVNPQIKAKCANF